MVVGKTAELVGAKKRPRVSPGWGTQGVSCDDVHLIAGAGVIYPFIQIVV